MKKLSFIIFALLGIICQSEAQNKFIVYQEKTVLNSIPTSEVDSITVAEDFPHIMCFWHNGNVTKSYDTAEIDSVIISNNENPLSYMGIVGFNNELYKNKIDILASSTSSIFHSFVNNLPRKDGTLLYYAVDNAIDMIDNAEINSPLNSINLITFTDGLDQGSVMMNTHYSSSREYLNTLSEFIKKNDYKGLPINAYSVGLRGNDVSDTTTFRNNLSLLASKADNSFEVGNVSDLRTKFKDIANQIISISTRQTISLKIPGIDNGTRMRFVFDSQTDEAEQLYIEGTFNLSDFTLRNVTYHGMKSRSGTVVQGTQDGIFVTFTFMGLQREDVTKVIPTDNIQHYYQLPLSSSWQLNSEFTPNNNTQRTISHRGSITVLVLDCSNSLGSDFSNVKQYANEFIDMISNNAQPFNLKAPTNANVEWNDSDDVVVSWNSVEYAENYQVFRSSTFSGYYTCVANNITSTSWIDENPLSGSNYYRIKAVGHGLTSNYSNTTNEINYALDVPNNIKATLDDENFNIVVTWDVVKHAECYQVYRSGYSNDSYTLVAENVNSTVWIDEKPLPGNNYYRIQSIGHGMNSQTSVSSNAVKYELAPPTNVTATLAENEFVIIVNWDAVKHAESYNVYRNNILVADSITTNYWCDSNPNKGSNSYTIYAVGHGMTSQPSAASSIVKYELAPPTNVTATLAENEFAIIVNWDAVKYAESYNVYRNNILIADGVTTNYWCDNNPSKGSNSYTIYAVGHGMTSQPSAASSIVKYELAPPTNVTAILDENEFVINVSWNAVKYAESYKVYRNNILIADGVTTNYWCDNNPSKGSNSYTIYAVGYGMISQPSAASSIVKYELAPPTNVTAILDENEFVINISWDAVKHAESYKIYRNNILVADNVTTNYWCDKVPDRISNYYTVYAVGHGITSEAGTSNIIQIADNPIIFVNYNGSSAQIAIPASVKPDITTTVDGAYVKINNTNIANEIKIVLSGHSSNGGFTYNGTYKATLSLNGLSLTSQRGAAIDIQCGKRMAIVLEDGTVNTLSDYAQGTQKACLYCKGHIEFEGAGTLNVTGNLTHAIKSKEYTKLKKSTGTINIIKAAGDAIHTGQYYQQNGGTVNITSTTLGDGIQAEYLMLDDDITPDPDEEFNGQMFIKGGKLNIEVSQEDCKAIKADDLITISGGTFQITASGNGSRGIQTDGSVIIGEEDNTTSITVAAKGGVCTNVDHEDDPHRCMGMKIDGNLTVNAGVITVTNTGTKSRGIKCTNYIKNGGTVTANLKIG